MIGRHDSFLALGGNSMQAIRMVNNLRTLGIDLGLDALFRHEDLAALRASITVHDVSSAPAEMSIIPFSMISNESVAKTLQTDRGVVDAYPAHSRRVLSASHFKEATITFISVFGMSRVWTLFV